ncbi:insulinase family protein [Henriciella mobilis]|uniref:M16 family metallopeptidase n=1 Tax=Henriciella mobilis TaxID=2305467 RepID=UPI000E664091|nr:pitrilysin family protein [Henriciella mobilis]RIJ16235.1 insulinase family protein [Henriciella mobilis]RIJ23179.1 insulinase family protein [Henriciella mobilis]
MRAYLAGGLAAVAFTASPAFADTAEAEWAPATFELDNGMEVVVLPDHRAPVVTHMVWYKVGAVDEDPGKSGIAHLFEHIMFKETDDLGPGEFDNIVSRLGGQNNAFTSWDYTAYYERVAKQHLEKMMELEAERMTDLIINDDPEGPFISERDVVKEERRQRIDNNPGVILQEQVMSALYQDHPYNITVIGKMEEVSALTPEDGLNFYRKWYTPSEAVLVVAGDVTPEDVRIMAENTYGQIEVTETEPPTRGWRPVEPLAETQLLTHSDPKVRQPNWQRWYLSTSYQEDKEMAYALDVALDVLGGGRTSRLYQALVEDQKIAVSASAGAWLSLHDTAPAILSASPSDGVSLDDLETAYMAVVADVLENGFTEEEVERSRNSLAASSIYQRDSQQSMANTYGSTLAIGGTVEDVLSYPDDIRAVTAEDAIAALRTVLGEDRNYIEAHLLPAEEEGDQ